MLQSLEAGHSRMQALEASNAALRLKVTQLSASPAASQAASGAPAGAKPETTGAAPATFRPASAAGTQQASAFEEHVRTYMDAKNCTRVDAVRACSQRHPELYQAAYGVPKVGAPGA